MKVRFSEALRLLSCWAASIQASVTSPQSRRLHSVPPSGLLLSQSLFRESGDDSSDDQRHISRPPELMAAVQTLLLLQSDIRQDDEHVSVDQAGLSLRPGAQDTWCHKRPLKVFKIWTFEELNVDVPALSRQIDCKQSAVFMGNNWESEMMFYGLFKKLYLWFNSFSGSLFLQLIWALLCCVYRFNYTLWVKDELVAAGDGGQSAKCWFSRQLHLNVMKCFPPTDEFN